MGRIINIIKDFSLVGKISLIALVIILIIAIFAPYLSKYPHDKPVASPLKSPTKEHILGTDDLGIDLWAQIIHGARISLIVGLGTALIAGVGGSTIGILAGYFGGFIDKFLMRLADVMIVLPELPTMIVLGVFFGSSIYNIIIVLSLFSWIKPARIVRSKTLSIKEENFIKIAQIYGAKFHYITIKHIMPYIFPLILISFIKLINRAIIAEASLSFLGLGDPTSKSWGLILNYAINFSGIYFTPYWKWWVLSPLIAITITVVSIAIIGREFEKIFKLKI
ncbi:ABC transporter permease [Thermohalobacter berrensis]|uniref:Peptide ABC transporter permease n=1 Tax=Thermohalobacter berrensis TaxID=99594 RepID=A0A419T8P2_9FIRM|nr:ABC transporter permease [Thermohalobacter berrensis]RKD33793.1 peptide ABC transporter permease [Thermohalobacter berrensis]